LDGLTHEDDRSFGRPLTRRLFAFPFLLVGFAWVGRTAESNFPLPVKLGFGLFMCGLCALGAREALRAGIKVSDDGVTIMSLARRRFVRWEAVGRFEIGTYGSSADVVVVCSDGLRLRTAGFRVFGGDPRTLEPYVEALTREQERAEVVRRE
jgi:hypothetical protein